MSVPFRDDSSEQKHRVWTLTFAAATTSDPFNIDKFRSILFHFPSGWTGTALTFKAANAYDGTYYDLMDDAGNAISLTVAASDSVAATTAAKVAALAAAGWIKVVSDQTETATVYVEGTA